MSSRSSRRPGEAESGPPSLAAPSILLGILGALAMLQWALGSRQWWAGLPGIVLVGTILAGRLAARSSPIAAKGEALVHGYSRGWSFTLGALLAAAIYQWALGDRLWWMGAASVGIVAVIVACASMWGRREKRHEPH